MMLQEILTYTTCSMKEKTVTVNRYVIGYRIVGFTATYYFDYEVPMPFNPDIVFSDKVVEACLEHYRFFSKCQLSFDDIQLNMVSLVFSHKVKAFEGNMPTIRIVYNRKRSKVEDNSKEVFNSTKIPTKEK